MKNSEKTHCIRGHEYNSENAKFVTRKDRGSKIERCCLLCQKARYEQEKEKVIKRSKEWAEKNPEKVSKYKKAWEERNPNHKKEYYWNNREELLAKSKTKASKFKYYLRRYGLTVEKYNEMYLRQNGCCAICRRPESSQKKAMAVEHSHFTNKVRALLCNTCNSGIGQLGDNPELVFNALEYLLHHEGVAFNPEYDFSEEKEIVQIASEQNGGEILPDAALTRN